MKKTIRLLLLVSLLAFLISGVPRTHAVLQASGGCLCWTENYIDGYQYGPPDVYEGSYQNDANVGTMGSAGQCADVCQGWVNGQGHYVCSALGIVDTGYVVEHWHWYYGDGGEGHLDEQYDCNDI